MHCHVIENYLRNAIIFQAVSSHLNNRNDRAFQRWVFYLAARWLWCSSSSTILTLSFSLRYLALTSCKSKVATYHWWDRAFNNITYHVQINLCNKWIKGYILHMNLNSLLMALSASWHNWYIVNRSNEIMRKKVMNTLINFIFAFRL